jgi:hypothetical protein
MDTLRSWIGEEGIVHPRYSWHRSDLCSNDTSKRAILYLIEEDIEGVRAVALIDIQGVVAWDTKVASRREARKHLNLELILHKGKEKVSAVLGYRGHHLTRASEMGKPRDAKLRTSHYAALFACEVSL